MKSLIFCTSFMRDNEAWESRYQRWLDYYKDIPIDAVKKIMIDDGSPFLPPAAVIKTVAAGAPLASETAENLLIHFDDNLGRSTVEDYPGWWRSFLYSVEVAKELGVDKIIHIESDAFILSPRLVDFINQTTSGWHVLWTPRHNFPETAIQVICRDQFDAFIDFKKKNPGFAFPDIAERLLPFTAVHREFIGDRYSEFRRRRGMFRSKKFNVIPFFNWKFFLIPIPKDADFVTQGASWQRLEFRRGPG